MPKVEMPRSFPDSKFPAGSQCSVCGRAILPEHVDGEGRCVLCQPAQMAPEGVVEPSKGLLEAETAKDTPPSSE